MFRWWIRHRRKKILQKPFPSTWKGILRRNVVYYRMLNQAERARLQKLIQVFIAEKHWEGLGGLVLDDEVCVTIAAQACLLILNLSLEAYRNVETILVYPTQVVPPEERPGFFETPLQPVEPVYPVAGQALSQGPLILAWDEVLYGGRHPEDGYNIVFHEFAHKLDMLNGAVDGTPLLKARAQYYEWAKFFSREFLRLRDDLEKGRRTFFDEYAAVDEAEFFAVATEQFFSQPVLMKKHAPEIYRLLSEYYGQDPAERTARKD